MAAIIGHSDMLAIIKILHVSCAFLSISGFFVRGVLMIKGSPWLHARIVKITPHIIDSLLLMSALVLVSQWGWAALQQPWLMAKIIALPAYIGLGMIVLREGRTMGVRIGACLAAMLVFFYIVAVALNKTPLIFS